jgi:hypothetical protein
VGKKTDATKAKKIKPRVDEKALKPLKPKKKCCESQPRCARCPLRLLAEGRMPEGWTVKHRRVVKIDAGKAGKSKKGKSKAGRH